MSASYFREALMEAADAVDLARGRANLSFSSELPILREDDPKYGTHIEILSHAPGDANLGLINRQGVVLMNHCPEQQIGCVVHGSARVDADRKARCTIELDPEYRELLQRISEDESLNRVSVGYSRLSVVTRGPMADGIPVLKFSWIPNEVSILTQSHPPADSTVGLGRSKPVMKNSLDEILSLALSASRKPADIDFSDYSLADALDFDRQPHGLVREAQAAAPGRIGGDIITGRYVPFGALVPQRRDMTVTGPFGQGGALVTGDVAPIVAVLKNRSAAVSLGATVLTGLEGPFLLPTQTSASSVTTTTETGAVVPADIQLQQRATVPRRATVQIPISKQLMIQSSGMEAFLRAEFASQIAVILDRLIFYGAAADEPVGIINTAGVGSVLFGGAATWPNILAFEKNLTDANADSGNLGFAESGSTRNKWKQASRIAATNFPSFLQEDGFVNAYPAVASNTLSATHQCVFGNWSDLWILIWGDGLEVIKDPYTTAAKGETVFTAHLWFNTILRHTQSMCVSADAGNQ